MKKTPLSIDLTDIVQKVTGKKAKIIFNDKRVNCRRYKFSGIFDITPEQIRKINNNITKKYPEHQFVVNNTPKKNKNSPFQYQSYYSGMTVKVF